MKYSYSCGSIDCGEEYIGESGRSFGERFKEHLKAPSPIFQHQCSSGHTTSINNFKIIGKEENSLARTIKRVHLHQSEQSYTQQEHWQI